MVTIKQIYGWYKFMYHGKIRVVRSFRKDKHGRLYADTKKDGTAGKTDDDYEPRCYRIDKIQNISSKPDPSAYTKGTRRKNLPTHDEIIEELKNLKLGEDM